MAKVSDEFIDRVVSGDSQIDEGRWAVMLDMIADCWNIGGKARDVVETTLENSALASISERYNGTDEDKRAAVKSAIAYLCGIYCILQGMAKYHGQRKIITADGGQYDLRCDRAEMLRKAYRCGNTVTPAYVRITHDSLKNIDPSSDKPKVLIFFDMTPDANGLLGGAYGGKSLGQMVSELPVGVQCFYQSMFRGVTKSGKPKINWSVPYSRTYYKKMTLKLLPEQLGDFIYF